MNNYNTSKDYDLLWELAKTQEDIICTYDSISLSEYKNKSVCVLKKILDSNIITMFPLGDFILGNNLDEKCFLETCKRSDLEFILPNAWISVKDRLPEDKGAYLWFIKGKIYIECFFPKLGAGYATHWQPMPEAPKGE